MIGISRLLCRQTPFANTAEMKRMKGWMLRPVRKVAFRPKRSMIEAPARVPRNPNVCSRPNIQPILLGEALLNSGSANRNVLFPYGHASVER
jgi:hypothetical protein